MPQPIKVTVHPPLFLNIAVQWKNLDELATRTLLRCIAFVEANAFVANGNYTAFA